MPTEFLKRYGRDMKAAMGLDVPPLPVRRNEPRRTAPVPRTTHAPVRIGELVKEFTEHVIPHPQRSEIARRIFNTENKL